ncbi:MAG: restriction endonuclease subunit S [Bacteroidales bacterium]|nr:MAG: restriction endonuclease subunit S [Bacteroidales bacterium]
MITTINNEHKELNFSSEREQSQACLNSAEHEKNQGRKVLNVPNLRFPEFQGEWEEYRIEDITENISSGRCKSHSPNGKYNLYGSTGIIGKTDEACYEGNLVLVARVGANAGSLQIINEPCGITDNTLIIKSKEVDAQYLYFFLQHFNLNRLIFGSGQPLITGGMLKKVKVSLGTVQEQNKLTRLLSFLDERIATQNKIIDKLQSLIKGIRNDVYGKLRKSVGFNAMISDVLSYEQPQPYIVENTEYTAEGIPVLTANKAFVLGYTSETNGIYDKGDCIIFDDFTLDCKYVDFPYKIKSSAIKILTAKNKELLRYTFEFLKYLDLSTEEHKRHYIAETQNQEFILPTMHIVSTIAHAFSALSLRMKYVVKQRNMFETQKQYLLRHMFI